MVSKDTPGNHQASGSFLFSIHTPSRGPKGTGTLHWPLCVFRVLHPPGQAAPLPKNPLQHLNSPQLLKLSTFFTKPLAGGVLGFWLVQTQSAGHKHTAQLSVRISRAQGSTWCPPGTRLGTDQGFYSTCVAQRASETEPKEPQTL